MSLKSKISEDYNQLLIVFSTTLLCLYVIFKIGEEQNLLFLNNSVFTSVSIIAIFFLVFSIYLSLLKNKINLNNKINRKLSIGLILSIISFLFLPISFLFISEVVGLINVGLIIFLIILDITQYDYYMYLYLKDNYIIFLRLTSFLTFIVIFVISNNVIFILLSLTPFIDILLKILRFLIISLVQFFLNGLKSLISFFYLFGKNIFRWIFEIIYGILFLIYALIIHYLSYFLIFYHLLKAIWENRIDFLKWSYFLIYFIGLAFLLFGGPHDIIFLLIFLTMTVTFILVFKKEISRVISTTVNLILHQKLEIFIAFMWLLTGLSFILTYLTFVVGLFNLAFPLFFMGLIFLHLAKIEVVQDFYKQLVVSITEFFIIVKYNFINYVNKLYYLLLNEFLYRFIQIINILLLSFGFYLFISGIFDPTGGLVENLLGIKIIALFPSLNIVFELLFGFSIIIISVILFITTVQNKKKLIR
jgi:hypothetical protein